MADSEEFSADDLEKLVGDILKKKNEGAQKGATGEGTGQPPEQPGGAPTPGAGAGGKLEEPSGLSPDALAALDSWLKRAPGPNATPDAPKQPKEESLEELLRKITPPEGQPPTPTTQPEAAQPIDQSSKEAPGDISQTPVSSEPQTQPAPPGTPIPPNDSEGQDNPASSQPAASKPERQMVTLPADELMGLVQKLGRLEGVLDDLMKVVETMRSEAKTPATPAPPAGMAEIEQLLKTTLPNAPAPLAEPPPPVMAYPAEPAEPAATPSLLSQVKDLAEVATQSPLSPVQPEIGRPAKAEGEAEAVTEPFQLRPGPEVLAGPAPEVLPKAEEKKPKGSSPFRGLRRLLNTPIGPKKAGQVEKNAKIPEPKAKAEAVKATPKKPKAQTEEQPVGTGDADYRGRVELEIEGEFEWSQLMDLQRELSKVAGIKYKGVWGSDAKTATLVLELGRTMPLMDSLRNLPSVRSVTAGRQSKGEQVIIVTLGSATQPVR